MRYLIAFLGFLGFANVYAMRVNLSVAIVSMVNSSAIPHVNASTSDVCPVNNSTMPDNQGVSDHPLVVLNFSVINFSKRKKNCVVTIEFFVSTVPATVINKCVSSLGW